MLAVLPPIGNLNGDSSNKQAEMESFSMILGEDDDFADFSSGNLVDSIDFDYLFCDSDVLPDLEMDPDLLAKFSLSSGDDYYSDINTATTTSAEKTAGGDSGGHLSSGIDSESGLVSSGLDDYSGCITSEGDEEMVSSKRDPDPIATDELGLQLKKQAINGRHAKANKSSSKALGVSSKGTSKDASQGKRKVKVDWTPELHRRFVQAVEQLGVDKAVPSRILEVMGIDCLTRHNIASHLQKYRSHRKHLLLREAEATSWSQRRHAYAAPMVRAGLGKRDRVSPWLVPTVGFPPITSLPPQPLHCQGHHARPFHVWGHPYVDQTLRPLRPKHPPVQQPHSIWPPPAHQMPRNSPPYWHPHAGPQSMQNGFYAGAPCFPQPPLGTTRVPAQTVQGVPPHAMYNFDPSIGVSTGPLPLPDFHPSMERVDAAIVDVLSKPWLPLPIGLKPPELESVMGELQRNGVPNIPPRSA